MWRCTSRTDTLHAELPSTLLRMRHKHIYCTPHLFIAPLAPRSSASLGSPTVHHGVGRALRALYAPAGIHSDGPRPDTRTTPITNGVEASLPTLSLTLPLLRSTLHLPPPASEHAPRCTDRIEGYFVFSRTHLWRTSVYGASFSLYYSSRARAILVHQHTLLGVNFSGYLSAWSLADDSLADTLFTIPPEASGTDNIRSVSPETDGPGHRIFRAL
ncbi:hypothetical protein B0H14DRAFT_2854530 [Mycena olivaceomarginata]|nr:hypothetical protein B0H14DRAFT_2854530 [Mycena olivaceomarginata]